MKNIIPYPCVRISLQKLIVPNALKIIVAVMLSLLVQPVHAQSDTDKKEVIKTLRTQMKKVMRRNFAFEDGDLAVEYDHENSNVSYVVTGKVSMFGVNDVDMETTVGVDNATINMVFAYPEGAVYDLQFDKLIVQNWIPPVYKGKFDLAKTEINLKQKRGNRYNYKCGIYLKQFPEQDFKYNNFELSNTELVFTIENKKSTQNISGIVNMGDVDFNLSGEAAINKKDAEWKLTASREELEMASLVGAFEKYSNIQLLGIPPSIIATSIIDPELEFDSDKAITLKGTTAIGLMESVVVLNNSGKNDVLLGYRPNEDYTLASLNKHLTYLDGMDLENIAIVYAYSKDKSKELSLGILEELEFASEEVKPGLILLGKYDLNSSVPLLDRIKSVTLRTDIPSDKSESIVLVGKLDFNELDLGALKVTEAFVSLEPSSKKMAIGMSVEGEIPEIQGGKDHLALSGETEFDKSSGELNLVLTMEEGEKWNTPFGLPGISISNFGLEVGASGKDKFIGVRGYFELSDLVTDLAGQFDKTNPSNSMIKAKIDELSMSTLQSVYFNQSVTKYFNTLPTKTLPAKIKDVELTIIPQPMSIAGKDYDPGLKIAGDADVLSMTADLDILAAYDSGIKGTATLDPVKIPKRGAAFFDLGGVAYLDITVAGLTNKDHVFFKTSGGVDLLGVSRSTEIELSKSGFYLINEGKIFGAFNARFDAKGKDFHNPGDAYVRVAMDADLMNTLNNSANSAMDIATSGKQEAFREARKLVEDAEWAYNQGKKKVDEAQAAKKEAIQGIEKAWDYVWSKIPNPLEKTFKNIPCTKNVSKKVPYLCGVKMCSKTVLGVTTKYPCGDKWCEKTVKVPTPSLCSYDLKIRLPGLGGKVLKDKYPISAPWGPTVYIPTPNFHNLMKGINAANDLLDVAIDKLQEANDELGLLKEALDLARAGLNELENATDYASLAAKWILDNATGVVDVKSAEFEGGLKSLSKGNVNMKCNVLFIGKEFNVELPFSFSDPTSMAEKMTDMLLHKKASSRFKSTFGDQLRGTSTMAYLGLNDD